MGWSNLQSDCTMEKSPPRPSRTKIALPPFLEMTTQNLTKSALASSHIEGDYPDPVAVGATTERLPLESTLHRPQQAEGTRCRPRSRSTPGARAHIAHRWLGNGRYDSAIQPDGGMLPKYRRSRHQTAGRTRHPDQETVDQPVHHVQHQVIRCDGPFVRSLKRGSAPSIC